MVALVPLEIFRLSTTVPFIKKSNSKGGCRCRDILNPAGYIQSKLRVARVEFRSDEGTATTESATGVGTIGRAGWQLKVGSNPGKQTQAPFRPQIPRPLHVDLEEQTISQFPPNRLGAQMLHDRPMKREEQTQLPRLLQIPRPAQLASAEQFRTEQLDEQLTQTLVDVLHGVQVPGKH